MIWPLTRPDPYALAPDWPPAWLGTEFCVLEHLAMETAKSDPLIAARTLFAPHEPWRVP